MLQAPKYAQAPFSVRMAKVYADELRVMILSELNSRDMSPTQFFNEFGGGTASRVAQHFQVLYDYGWIFLVKTETGGRRRGGVEHFYRATEPAVFYDDAWRKVPQTMKEAYSGRVLETLMERAADAMRAETIDARADRHLTWVSLRLDELGWSNSVGKFAEVFEWQFEEQERARGRLADSGEEAIPATASLILFESPPDIVAGV